MNWVLWIKGDGELDISVPNIKYFLLAGNIFSDDLRLYNCSCYNYPIPVGVPYLLSYTGVKNWLFTLDNVPVEPS